MSATSTETTDHRTSRPRCACLHPTPWAAEPGVEPCVETAAFEVSVEERTVLLCVVCLEAWQESDRHRYGTVRLTAREL